MASGRFFEWFNPYRIFRSIGQTIVNYFFLFLVVCLYLAVYGGLMAGVVGGISTIMVQSSSVTTSLIVPLVGAGAIKLRRAFPFMLGCNIGTTVTAVIVATANPVEAAVGVAICHVCFNVVAAAIWYPMRFVPIGLATWYGQLAARSKWYYVAFLLVVYFAIPSLGYLISSLLGE